MPLGRRTSDGWLVLYTRAVSALGLAALFHAVPEIVQAPRPSQWLLFSAVVLVVSHFPVRIASVQATISVSDTFFIAAVLLFGPEPAMLMVAVDSFVLSLQKGHAWNHIFFNTAVPALSLELAGRAFFVLSASSPLSGADAPVAMVILPLLSLTLIYFGLNSGLMAIAIGLESGQSPIAIWRKHFAALSLPYLAAGSMALFLVLIIKQVGILALPIILPVVAEFHLTLRTIRQRSEEAERHLAQTNALYMATVEMLATAMDAKDAVTHGHVKRVQALAMTLAASLPVTDQPTLKAIETAALLHDTGKLAVPEYILNKPGSLTVDEFALMQRHVDVGADILALVPFPFPVVPIVRCHHENWDGSGYPRGIAGTDIPIGARILSVVDCYDALTSDRPYRRRVTDEAALTIVRERRGTMYDPRVVDAFMGMDRVGTLAQTSSEELAQVFTVLHPARSAGYPAARATESAGEQGASEEGLEAVVSRIRAASAAATLPAVLGTLTSVIVELAPLATGAWFIPDEGGTYVHATEPFGDGAGLLIGKRFQVGEGLTGWVAAHRQVIVNSDAALDLGDAISPSSSLLANCLSMPVLDGDLLVCVLTLYTGAQHPFTEDQRCSLQTIGPHVARTIHGALPASARQEL